MEGGRRIGQRIRSRRGHDVLERRSANRRAIWVGGDGQRYRRIEVGRVSAGGLVPAAPNHRVAARHKERVPQDGWVGDRARIIAARKTTQGAPRLVPAVRRLVHHSVCTPTQVDWLENIEVKPVLAVPLRVPPPRPTITTPPLL